MRSGNGSIAAAKWTRVFGRSRGVLTALAISGLAGLIAAQAWAAAPPAGGLKVKKSSRTGLATFVNAADHGPIPVNPGVAGGPLQPADFLAQHGAFFGISDPARTLIQTQATTDALGYTHTTYEQVQNGVRVFAGIIKVHQNAGGQIVAANGHFFPIPQKLVTNPALTPAKAEAVARSTLPGATLVVQHSELVIVDPGWYGDPPIGPHLAYYIVLLGQAPTIARMGFFIDAQNGSILDQWSMLENVKNRQIYTANETFDIPGTLVRSEGQPAASDADVNRAYDYAGDTYDFYFRAFGRDGLDGVGGTLMVVTHSIAPGCPNAYWDGTQMVFCTGTVTDDVMAHELSHGVTENTANLIYQNQPGQLNESFSDVFGELVDLYNGNAAFAGTPGGTPWPTTPTGPGQDTPNNARTSACSLPTSYPDGVRWLMGEDATAFGGAIRDMWDPPCFDNPDRANSPLETCDPLDNGGVHSGSGVPNHAFAMLTDGTTFNGHTIAGIGPIKAGAVWYRALSTYLTESSDFSDAYAAFNQAAADLVGTFPNDPRTGLPSTAMFTTTDAIQVDQALLATEMDTDGACGGNARLTSITPNTAPNLGSVHITDLVGANFESGSTVQLTRAGSASINATAVTVVDVSHITCTYRTSWAAVGVWNVVVNGPSGGVATLTNGFTITASPPGLTVDAPRGGESWPLAGARAILWGSVGGGSTVDIDLLKGGSLYGPIAHGVTNNGTYNWTIPADLPEASDYAVRITDGALTAQSPSNFTVFRYNDECSSAVCIAEGVPYTGETVDATGTDITSCANGDTLDVWHAYTPITTGSVTIATAGSDFDTTLAVFDACEGTELACDDDGGSNRTSLITMNMDAGVTYLIRVAGYGGDSGNYVLSVTGGGGICGPCLRPPVAQDSNPSVRMNASSNVVLPASDCDRQPLAYRIVTLPARGTLADPHGGAITTPGYVLLAGGNTVTYTPMAGYQGSDSFTFIASDGGTPPTGGDSNVATVSITVVLYSANMDTNPGWTLEGAWAWGQPIGGGSSCHDPVSGHTGTNVVGYNLAGDYPNNLLVQYARTPAINCTLNAGMRLSFYRWLGVESSNYDKATIQVSNNGTTWVTVWQHTDTSSVCDGAWIREEYDISAVADNQPTVYVRWGMGPSDGSVTYPGWNIDDVQVNGTPCTMPEAPANPQANPPAVCVGGGSVLSATVGAGEVVDWYTGSCFGTLVPGGANPTVSPTATTTYYARARNSTTGCLSLTCSQVSLTVLATPGTPTNPQANPPQISAGQSSTLSATVGAGEHVAWFTGSCGGTPVPGGATPTVTPQVTTTYYAQAVNNTTGCMSAQCATTRVLVPGRPSAQDGSASTRRDLAVNVTVTATDLEGDPLTYVVSTLPAYGGLRDPGAGAITVVPYTLVGGGHVVVYTPVAGYVGPDSFKFKANDGHVPPAGGDSNEATMSITVTPAAYYANMDTNPGWALDADWAWGRPLGGGSNCHDPAAGFTGLNVVGYNLSGDYPNNLTPVRYARTPAIDGRYFSNLKLSFYRWLGVESSSYDHAAVEISNNGTAWTTVWQHAGTTLCDGGWVRVEYDISAIADGQPAVYVRWAMGPSDGSVTYPGWNIDDVEVTGTYLRPLTPSNPQATRANVCAGQPSTLSATVGAGEVLEWFAQSCGGTLVAGGGTPTVSPTTTTTYYGRARNLTSGYVSPVCCQLTIGVCTCMPEDFDGDCDVDFDDFAAFRNCFSGPMVPVAAGCEGKDLNGDGTVDMRDFAVFQKCFSGAGRPVDPNCGN